MPNQMFSVDGLHCEGCVDTVTGVLSVLPGVESVDVALETTGVSQVSVSSTEELTSAQVQSALATKGNFRVVS